ncbi:cytochrome P450 2H2-like [Amblyomma americanum]
MTIFSGEEWKENRHFSMRALAKLGLGSAVMCQHIQEEALHLADTLESRHGCSVAPRTYIQKAYMNSICRYLLGYRYDLEDPRRKPLDDAVSGYRLQSTTAPVERRTAWLPRTLINLLWPRSTSAERRLLTTTLNAVCRQLVEINNDSKRDQREQSYIDLYIKKIHEAEKSHNRYFRVDALVGNMVDILTATAVLGPQYLHWNLLNLAIRADTLQAELHQEIDSVVGFDRSPKWEDHTRMPLTMATIWEMFRWKVAAPFNIPRGVARDKKFRDYLVVEGTMVLPNLLAVHRDPKQWKNPDTFDPSRFLKPDGTAQTASPKGMLTFSVGKRMCPEEGMAMVQMFVLLTTLLHRFRILPEEGDTIEIPPLGTSLELSEKKLRFIPRKVQ